MTGLSVKGCRSMERLTHLPASVLGNFERRSLARKPAAVTVRCRRKQRLRGDPFHLIVATTTNARAGMFSIRKSTEASENGSVSRSVMASHRSSISAGRECSSITVRRGLILTRRVNATATEGSFELHDARRPISFTADDPSRRHERQQGLVCHVASRCRDGGAPRRPVAQGFGRGRVALCPGLSEVPVNSSL